MNAATTSMSVTTLRGRIDLGSRRSPAALPISARCSPVASAIRAYRGIGQQRAVLLERRRYSKAPRGRPFLAYPNWVCSCPIWVGTSLLSRDAPAWRTRCSPAALLVACQAVASRVDGLRPLVKRWPGLAGRVRRALRPIPEGVRVRGASAAEISSLPAHLRRGRTSRPAFKVT